MIRRLLERVSVYFAWYDLWIGAYVGPDKKIYICPLPCCVIRIDYSEDPNVPF